MMGDTKQLIPYFDKYEVDGVYSEIFKLLIYYQYNDKTQIKLQLMNLIKRITGDSQQEA